MLNMTAERLFTAPMAGQLINAGIVVGRVDTINPVALAFAAIAVQGTGFQISFMICAAFLYRLMTQKLPRDTQRPGVVSAQSSATVGTVSLAADRLSSFPSDQPASPWQDWVSRHSLASLPPIA